MGLQVLWRHAVLYSDSTLTGHGTWCRWYLHGSLYLARLAARVVPESEMMISALCCVHTVHGMLMLSLLCSQVSTAAVRYAARAPSGVASLRSEVM